MGKGQKSGFRKEWSWTEPPPLGWGLIRSVMARLLVPRSEVERVQSDCIRRRDEVKPLPGGYSMKRWTDSRSGAALAQDGAKIVVYSEAYPLRSGHELS